MTTTSANIAHVVTPLGKPLRRFAPGMVYDLGKLKKKKKKNKTESVYEVFTIDGHVLVEGIGTAIKKLFAKKEKKHKIDGKIGVWRTIKGKHYFFPDDKSGPIPPMKW